MADEDKKPKPPTHTAFALKREGPRMRYRRWLEIGTGRCGEDGSFTAYLDRTPLGGWTGYVHFVPVGKEPPPLAVATPHRPGSGADEADEQAEE